MASANGNGATGTSKGHEQASGIGQKVQDFAQKAMGAAGDHGQDGTSADVHIMLHHIWTWACIK
jgi:hypothetical protein